MSHLFQEEQIIIDRDIRILSRFININLKRLCTENGNMYKEATPNFDLQMHSLVQHIYWTNACYVPSWTQTSVWCRHKCCQYTESTRNIPRKFFAKTILGGNVMDLEPPAELEPGEPIKLYLITTPCDPVLSAGLDAQWFRHITLICGKKKIGSTRWFLRSLFCLNVHKLKLKVSSNKSLTWHFQSSIYYFGISLIWPWLISIWDGPHLPPLTFTSLLAGSGTTSLYALAAM